MIAYKRVLGAKELVVLNNFSNQETAFELSNEGGKIIVANCDVVITNGTISLAPYASVVVATD